MKKKILIVGASGHARVIIDIVECAGLYEIVGILDKKLPVGSRFEGYEVLGSDEEGGKFSGQVDGALIAVGDNAVRARVVEKVGKFLPFVSAVHPAATVARSATISDGTVVMAGACINPGSTIGKFCILNTASSLDHECTLADYASLAPGVVIGGNCCIGEFSAISIGAVVKHGVAIGAETVIGAGSVVLSDMESNAVAYGCPARIVRKRSHGDKYL